MSALRLLSDLLPDFTRPSKSRRSKTRRSPRSSTAITITSGPLWLERRRAMSIESLENRQLLSASPTTLYVANAFADQTTGQTTTSPAAGDTVNWLASGSFSEVDGLTFGVNAFTSIQAAVNAAASGDTIDVAGGSYVENVEIASPISLVGAGPQTVLQGPSTRGTGIAIDTAAGTVNVDDLTISGFQTGVTVSSVSVANLTGDTITDNQTGSGIFNHGTLTLSESSVTDNLLGTGGDGGGIVNGGTMTISASTISGNFANLGGGIYNFGDLTVSNSTIAGNSAADDGGGIENAGGFTVTLEDSTVSNNSVNFDGGGGFDNRGTANVANTIIAGNSATGTNAIDPDVRGVFTSTDHDLIGVTGDATGFTTTGLTASIVLGSDSVSAVGLGPLADNGGPTQTMALLAGSPAIDAGNAAPGSPFSVPDADQRGQARTSNGTIDVGAYETAPTTLYVATSFFDQTTGANTSTPNAGDTVNWLASGSFAEVDGLTFGVNAFTSIQSAANALGRTIDVAAGTYVENVELARPLTINGAGPQTVLKGPSSLGTGIAINTTAGTVNVSGLTISGFQTGVDVSSVSVANLTGDTITGNHAGPGIFNHGTLVLSQSSVTDNLLGAGGDGGGILNGGTMTISASTISGNFANLGGGIYNFGRLTVSDSTIAGNTAADDGGGIENAPGFTLIVNDSTISGNTVEFDAGGGIDNRGTGNVANTIVAGNSATGVNASDPDVHGVYTSTDHDLIGVTGDATGFTTTGLTASIVLGSDSASAVGLGPLADNGGPTQTMALLAGSLAIDAGDNAPPAPFSVPAADQRGVTRITATDPIIDIGAYEAPGVVPPAVTSFVVEKGLEERSYIRYLDVTFNTPVSGLKLDAAHVKLEHFGLDGATDLGSIDLTNKISLVDKVMEIDFGAGGIGGHENLPALLADWTKLIADDGYYKLVIDADGTGQHDIELDFYRLFGDVIGNPTGGATTTGNSISGSLTFGVPTAIGQVTTGDVNSISASVGQTGSLLNDDINGAGSVTPNDRLLAARSAGRQLAAGLHLDD